MATIEISSRAKKDLKRIGPGVNLTRITVGLRDLEAGVANLDVKTVDGHRPWLRLRIGEFRVLYRPLGGDWWVERVMNRQDLREAVKTLG
jgi:mRNA-degrading endonuclease RelE of RelBE toxin-antitoxin system